MDYRLRRRWGAVATTTLRMPAQTPSVTRRTPHRTPSMTRGTPPRTRDEVGPDAPDVADAADVSDTNDADDAGDTDDADDADAPGTCADDDDCPGDQTCNAAGFCENPTLGTADQTWEPPDSFTEEFTVVIDTTATLGATGELITVTGEALSQRPDGGADLRLDL